MAGDPDRGRPGPAVQAQLVRFRPCPPASTSIAISAKAAATTPRSFPM
ncbi:hypothetical protein [Lysobacter gummosus]